MSVVPVARLLKKVTRTPTIIVSDMCLLEIPDLSIFISNYLDKVVVFRL